MNGSTLDIPIGEMSAICDFGMSRAARGHADYFDQSSNTCLLCGPVAPASNHLHTKAHRTRVASYYYCTQGLLTLASAELAAGDSGVSRRETILAYLGGRISRSIVTSGIGAYNHVAVAYLLRRCEASDLLSAFRNIRGGAVGNGTGICTVCMERPSTIMFEACKHVCICCVCVSQLPLTDAVGADRSCPICRVATSHCSVFIA